MKFNMDSIKGKALPIAAAVVAVVVGCGSFAFAGGHVGQEKVRNAQKAEMGAAASDYGVTDYGVTDYGTTDYNEPASDYGATDYNEPASDYGNSDYGDSDYDD